MFESKTTAFVLFLLFATLAECQQPWRIHVNSISGLDGSDRGNSSSAPLQTLDYALSRAQAGSGDTEVLLASGQYYYNSTTTFSAGYREINVKTTIGSPIRARIIFYQSLKGCSQLNFEDLDIVAENQNATDAMIRMSGGNCIIQVQRCSFEGNWQSGPILNASDVNIIECVFENLFLGANVLVSDNAMIYTSTFENITFSDTFLDGASFLDIFHTTFRNNSVLTFVRSSASQSLLISGSTFEDPGNFSFTNLYNCALSGSRIVRTSPSRPSSITVSGTYLQLSDSQIVGIPVRIENFILEVFVGVNITGVNSSGPALILNGVDGGIISSSIGRNEIWGTNGAIHIENSVVFITYSELSGNIGGSGHAISCVESTVILNKTSVYNNVLPDISCVIGCQVFGIPDPCDSCERDRCSVCNGTNDCLDCSGRPFATPRCVTTQQLTTKPLSTARLTTRALTTSPLTTEKLTTSQLTTGAITTGIGNEPTSTTETTIIVPASGSDSDDSSRRLGIIGGVLGGSLGVVVVAAFVLVLHFRRQNKPRQPDSVELSVQESPDSSNYVALVNRSPQPATSSPIPEIDDVVVGPCFARGHFGEVFKGFAWGATQVALKKLKSEDWKDFLAEATILTAIKHPNCVMFLGVFTDPEKQRYIAMEYCEKGNLLDYFKANQKLEMAALTKIAYGAGKGMAYLERCGIVHRDLAARNLLVDSNGTVKVADFGLSRALNKSDYYKVQDASNAVFPIKWSAPEVINFQRYSSQTDVWSMGITLYEIFTSGKVPYPSMSNEMASARLNLLLNFSGGSKSR
eukprot:TRINITY_DN5690_c0_g1_i6.p1 TRINITY_DN5690_c0_g1~~TRINITY_DN5690_c0_g1_i6.p1  ORF type:complete len:803 (-),score=75.86 TRINITY_DN5690_c0_g1_i6:228-2636(-)